MTLSSYVNQCSTPCPYIFRDGTYRLWNGTDLKHFKTMSMGSSWITGCIYMSLVRGKVGVEC